MTPRLGAWFGVVVLFAAASYYGNYGIDRDENAQPLYESAFWISSLFGFGLLVGVAFTIAVGLPKRATFALRRPTSWGRALLMGAGILLAVFALSAIVGLFLDPGGEQGLLPDTWPPPDALVFALNVVAVVAGAPIAEELMFRGLGFTLLERLGPAVAIVGSSIAWAAAHGLVQAFPLIFALGVGLGLLRRATRSILPGMLLHASFNAIAVAAAVAEASHG